MRIKCKWHTYKCCLDGEGTCFPNRCDYEDIQDNCPSAEFTDGKRRNGLLAIYANCIYGDEETHIVENAYKRFKYDESEGTVTFGNNRLGIWQVDYLECDGTVYINKEV